MILKAIVHEDPDGLWAEQAETMDDLLVNLRDAIEGCLFVEINDEPLDCGRMIKIAV
ncbi:MAG: hypothetical protein ACXW5U_21795 [Thermoanaerobaculia bacterium]